MKCSYVCNNYINTLLQQLLLLHLHGQQLSKTLYFGFLASAILLQIILCPSLPGLNIFT